MLDSEVFYNAERGIGTKESVGQKGPIINCVLSKVWFSMKCAGNMTLWNWTESYAQTFGQ